MKIVKKVIFIVGVLWINVAFSQNVAITDDNTYSAHSSAMLDVKSTTKGFLIPRLTTSQRTTLGATATTGLLVYDTDLNGFMYWTGSLWTNLTSGNASGIWSYNSPNVYLTNTNNRVGVGTTSPYGKMEVKADASITSNTPIFQVVNTTGDTVFAVYPQGVRINVQDDPGKASGNKGGFAVGGFAPSKGAVTNEFLRVTPDSVRIYIEDDPAKASGSKGGFAVGGFTPSKTTATNYLDLTPDNYFIGHESGINTVPGVGSFGRYNTFLGYQSGKGNIDGQNNVIIGYQSGLNATSGDNNIFIGNNTGAKCSTGHGNVLIGINAGSILESAISNVIIGEDAGISNVSGSSNVIIGKWAGRNTTSGSNTFVGTACGYYNNAGTDNVFMGYAAGYANTTGNGNSSFGVNAGNYNATGNYNSAFGYGAGNGKSGSSYSNNCYFGYKTAYYNMTGSDNIVIGYMAGYGTLSTSDYDYNVFIGKYSGYKTTTASTNTFLGNYTGYNNQTGTGNVFLGYSAGYSETGSSKLYIDNSSTSTPLIGGDFSANRVGINRMPTSYTLEVGGTIWANGATISSGATTWSDERYKKNIQTLENPLDKIKEMRGVTYDWKKNEFPDMNFPEGKQIGVIAQEIEKYYPELVSTDENGYKSVSYEKLTPILLEAIKQLQTTIDNQNSEINSLKEKSAEIDKIKAEINEIKETLDFSTKK